MEHGSPNNCDLLPSSLQWLCDEAPAFPVHSSKVHIITEPGDFYRLLKERVTTANTRIVLASLYLGSGDLEHDLVQAVSKRLCEVPGLSVQWLLDYTRGSRMPASSRQTLQPLLHHPNCQVSLFHTPELRGWLKKLLPQRWNEVVGLQHMKLYIFDDCLLISGANLSGDYFRQRQDRYFLVTGVPELVDFFHQVVEAVSGHSLLLSADDSTSLHPGAPHHPYLGDYTGYCAAVESSVRAVWHEAMQGSVARLQAVNNAQLRLNPGKNATAPNDFAQRQLRYNKKRTPADGHSSLAANSPNVSLSRTQRNLHSEASTDRPPDTIIFPTLQMKSFNINYDTVVTKKLLTRAVPGSIVHLASGYFNLTQEYMNSVLQTVAARFSILCAHPEANGFLGASGVAGAIPAFYTQLAKQFMERVDGLGQGGRVMLWEYQRLGWTFHAKGLWYSLPLTHQALSAAADAGGTHQPSSADATADTDRSMEEVLPCLTLVGSPNFGWRSVNRDLESQLVLVTTNPRLQRQLEAERSRLFKSASRVHRDDTFSQASRYVKLWVRCLVPIIKKFF